MAVSFIEGFDLSVDTPNQNQFVQNFNQYWSDNFTGLVYASGYSSGQSGQFNGCVKTASKVTNVVPNDGVMRIHFWAKMSSILSGTSYAPVFALGRDGSNSDDVWMLEVNGSGSARLSQGDINILGGTSNVTVLDGPVVSVVDDDTWQYFELLFDEDSGIIRLFKNNSEILTATGVSTVPFGASAAGLHVSRDSVSNPIQLDHIIITDGESLVGAAVGAVAVGCSIEGASGAQGSGLGFCGNLVIDGVSYKTDFSNQSLDGASNDENYAPATYHLYPTNPATGGAWDAAGLASIEAWGVCYNDTQTSRISNLVLITVVADEDTGFPILSNTTPGSALYASGPWTKTNTNLTYGGHLSDIPIPALRSTDEWLEISDPGCILFNHNTILTSFGITFAEEYREDFVDWKVVDGSGVNYDSYFMSGYLILGDSNKKFQSNYVTVNYEDVTVGGAYLQGVWDYSLDGNTGRWSVKQQIYNDLGNYKHQARRLKVRGHGKALQFRIESEDGKDFKINGWAVQASGNSGV